MDTDSSTRPWECFAPLSGVAIGIAIAVFAGAFIPAGWEDSWKNFTYSKGLILQAAIVFWCLGVAIRGNRIHCGGSLEADSRDKAKNTYLIFILLFLFILAITGYILAIDLIFLLPLILTMLVAFSEVGWGDPLKFIRGSWG